MIESKRDMIATMYTDRERRLPLMNSKETIMNTTKDHIEALCSTSNVAMKKDKDQQTQYFNTFFASLLGGDLGNP